MVKYLIIGSGGMVGIKFVGVMVKLKEIGALDDLQEISSASIGSLIGLLYIFYKGDLEKLLKQVFEFDIKSYTKTNIKNLLYRFGLVDSKNFEGKLLEILGGTDLTFQELYDINPIKLYVSSYEVMSDRTIYMSVDKTPDLSVIKAVLRSISIPFVFVPEISGTQIFLDGASAEENPYEPFLKYAINEVIEIRMSVSGITSDQAPPKTLFGYLVIILTRLLRNSRIRFDNFKRINVECSQNDSLNFGATHDEKVRMYTDGYSTIR